MAQTGVEGAHLKSKILYIRVVKRPRKSLFLCFCFFCVFVFWYFLGFFGYFLKNYFSSQKWVTCTLTSWTASYFLSEIFHLLFGVAQHPFGPMHAEV